MPPFPCSKTSHTVTVYSLSEYAVKLTEKKKKMHFSARGSEGPIHTSKIPIKTTKNNRCGTQNMT